MYRLTPANINQFSVGISHLPSGSSDSQIVWRGTGGLITFHGFMREWHHPGWGVQVMKVWAVWNKIDESNFPFLDLADHQASQPIHHHRYVSRKGKQPQGCSEHPLHTRPTGTRCGHKPWVLPFDLMKNAREWGGGDCGWKTPVNHRDKTLWYGFT